MGGGLAANPNKKEIDNTVYWVMKYLDMFPPGDLKYFVRAHPVPLSCRARLRRRRLLARRSSGRACCMRRPRLRPTARSGSGRKDGDGDALSDGQLCSERCVSGHHVSESTRVRETAESDRTEGPVRRGV